MRFSLRILFVVLLGSTIICGQELTRDQKLQKINELRNQVKNLANDYLQPYAEDLTEAKKEGFGVFRILPRNLLDGKVGIREGGAYYSFTTKSNDYDDIPQIGFEQNYLSVGFAGANYGFMADLGGISLSEIDKKTTSVEFLINYSPPNELSKARIEQERSRGFEESGIGYKSRFPAVIGHTYILRAISFGSADILVAFKIHRKDTDGSLIIFWKLLENFEKPLLAINQ